ncbi:uncharacterized protein H6S33_005443 [Morchella sextelata]|uniref:uncharacterized protein n=1 Tax=Morchella sextelata TaxID=1174677 RepID=UPI001D04ECFF|nr:uncharacterized protein H6S33_005443 [Morchella sextelata]KAH0613557.1 hypothetical protein H6S33_005443 [Morchella sextelata]
MSLRNFVSNFSFRGAALQGVWGKTKQKRHRKHSVCAGGAELRAAQVLHIEYVWYREVRSCKLSRPGKRVIYLQN